MYKINSHLLGLEDIFTFGRHSGEQVEDLIDDDPSYFAWLIENEICEFEPEVITVLEKKKII